MAELENDIGNTARSLEILEYLDRLMKDVLRWRWEKAMLAYLLGREDILTTDLSWLLQQENLSRQTRKKVLNFAFSLWSEPAELAKKMGEKNKVRLFLRAVQKQYVDTASFLWSLIDRSQLDAGNILQYINLLIKKERVEDAKVIWKEYYPTDKLLYNGDFSRPLVKGGFGWRVWKIEGAEAELHNQETEKTALHVHFNGKHNIGFYHINQVVPLPPSQDFALTGELRSQELTTDQRPFIEIIGRNCSRSLYAKTEMVEADQDWSFFSLDFTVPDECRQGIVIRLRRLPSKNIDSLISGDLWFTNLSLQSISHKAPE
ncbi:MAG: hypothetical protein D3904_09920 [Candidatus Electrothrix sp. EH2]|nr:hypothetical protein [Candidatus Electrothrix sp. EH2]